MPRETLGELRERALEAPQTEEKACKSCPQGKQGPHLEVLSQRTMLVIAGESCLGAVAAQGQVRGGMPITAQGVIMGTKPCFCVSTLPPKAEL